MTKNNIYSNLKLQHTSSKFYSTAEVTKVEMNEALLRFVLAMRKRDESEYPPNTCATCAQKVSLISTSLRTVP